MNNATIPLTVVKFDAKELKHPTFNFDIPIGMYFIGAILGHEGLFLKLRNLVVYIENPTISWVDQYVPITNYKPIGYLEIKVCQNPPKT